MTYVENSKFKIQNEARAETLPPTPHQQDADGAERNIIRDKSFKFGVEVIRFARSLREIREYELASQFVRAGTSVGANVEESIAAQSKRDFMHKLSIALKEAREALYWIRLLIQSETGSKLPLEKLRVDALELVRILSKILITCQQRYGEGARETSSEYGLNLNAEL
ncbi:MAG: four helix bundle protein [Candidatus Sumerlaeaceae bacterium]